MIEDIKSITQAELLSQLEEWKEPKYRSSQVLDWVYKRRVASWDEMSNIPKDLREKLAQRYQFSSLEMLRKQGSQDTTQKFLWRLGDHSLIESVLIPANPALYGEASDRHTLCVSTQVGCAYGCKFCASGLEGLKRNLQASEIVDQVLAVERWHSCRPEEGPSAAPTHGERLIDNLVIMGMGEPLANYENLLKALQILNAAWGVGIGARKITVSTSGLAPQIRRLADEPFQFRLAISLHGATDEVRGRIMPVNRKYPLAELTAACAYFRERKGGMITLEYILISGVNDAPSEALSLAKLAIKLGAKVNLIPYNTVEGLPWSRPDLETQEKFLKVLTSANVKATLRREKGHDIDAACGQLRLRTEREFSDSIPTPARSCGSCR